MPIDLAKSKSQGKTPNETTVSVRANFTIFRGANPIVGKDYFSKNQFFSEGIPFRNLPFGPIPLALAMC